MAALKTARASSSKRLLPMTLRSDPRSPWSAVRHSRRVYKVRRTDPLNHRHAVGIHVSWDGDRATLVVADRGPGIPIARPVPGPDATSGRGLLIVQAIAPRVDIDAVAGYGSRVTVVLPVRRKRAGEPAHVRTG